MRLLDIISQTAESFTKVSEVAQYIELREKLQKTCPEGWSLMSQLELKHWGHFGGIPTALKILRQNMSNNSEISGSILRDIQSLVDNKLTNDLEALAVEIARFVDNLSHYLLKPDANLEAEKLKLPSVLRRLLLNAKGCLQGTEEFRNIRLAVAKGPPDTKAKAELYEQEIRRRNIILPILPESYNLVVEIAGADINCRKSLIATKQLLDMVKVTQQLLFNLTIFNNKCSFQVDGDTINLKYEEKPFGRVINCHAVNILPLMMPGHILRFIEPSTKLSIYVGLLSVECNFNSGINEIIVDLSGIDLEDTGPKLLSRFTEY